MKVQVSTVPGLVIVATMVMWLLGVLVVIAREYANA